MYEISIHTPSGAMLIQNQTEEKLAADSMNVVLRMMVEKAITVEHELKAKIDEGMSPQEALKEIVGE